MGRPVKAWVPKASDEPRPVRTCVGYVRVSTARQASDGFGIDAQRDAITAEASKRGWALIGIHTDAGVSGTVDGRPGLVAALDDVTSGRADAFVTSELSRVGRPREASTLHRFLEVLKASGATFVSITEPWMGTDAFTVGIAVAMAQGERTKLLARMASGRIAKATRGGVVGRPPFGYRVADAGTPDARFVVDDEAAAVVRRIFRERAAGVGVVAVADGLMRDGVASPSGRGRWDAHRVSKVHRNPAYRGTLRWREGTREVVVPNAFPAIVEGE
jgi:site-specific DNA recombinase